MPTTYNFTAFCATLSFSLSFFQSIYRIESTNAPKYVSIIGLVQGNLAGFQIEGRIR